LHRGPGHHRHHPRRHPFGRLHRHRVGGGGLHLRVPRDDVRIPRLQMEPASAPYPPDGQDGGDGDDADRLLRGVRLPHGADAAPRQGDRVLPHADRQQVRNAAAHQHPAARARHFHGPRPHAAHLHTDPAADGDQAGRRPRPLRNDHADQPRNRPDHAAGRSDALRRLRHRQGDDRAGLEGAVALLRRDVRGAADHHVRAGHLAVAAQPAQTLIRSLPYPAKEETMSVPRKLSVLAALALVLAAPYAALGQQKLKFAHVYETSEPYHTWALWAAGEIAKRTGDRYTMDVFPASSLGNETQINQSLSLGTVDMTYTGQAFAARIYPPLGIGGAPYLFRDADHAKKFNEVQSHINLTGHMTEMLFVIVSGPLWSRLSLGEREVFQDVFREACAKATAEIAASEIRLVDEFAKKYGKTAVKSDRAAFKRAFAKFLVGPDVAWDKALYDKVQALK